MGKSMAASMKQIIQTKVLSALVNDENIRENYKQMFEESEWLPAERTLHTAIPPANVRI